jgi:hypothetical protein
MKKLLKRHWFWGVGAVLIGLVVSGMWLFAPRGNGNRLSYRNFQRAIRCTRLTQVEAILGPASTGLPSGFPFGDSEIPRWRYWAGDGIVFALKIDDAGAVRVWAAPQGNIRPNVVERILSWLDLFGG